MHIDFDLEVGALPSAGMLFLQVCGAATFIWSVIAFLRVLVEDRAFKGVASALLDLDVHPATVHASGPVRFQDELGRVRWQPVLSTGERAYWDCDSPVFARAWKTPERSSAVWDKPYLYRTSDKAMRIAQRAANKINHWIDVAQREEERAKIRYARKQARNFRESPADR